MLTRQYYGGVFCVAVSVSTTEVLRYPVATRNERHNYSNVTTGYDTCCRNVHQQEKLARVFVSARQSGNRAVELVGQSRWN